MKPQGERGEGKSLIRMTGGSQEAHKMTLSSVFPQEGHFLNGSKVDIVLGNQLSQWISSDFLVFLTGS